MTKWLPSLLGVVLGGALVAAMTAVVEEEATTAAAGRAEIEVGGSGADARVDRAVDDDAPVPAGASDAERTPGGSRGRSGGANEGTSTSDSASTAGGPAEVVVSIVVPDTGALARVGLVSTTPEQNEHWWSTYLEIESELGGPRMKPHFVRFDALDAEDRANACQPAVEVKPVIVLGQSGFNGPGVLCVTERFGVPALLIEGEADEYYRRAKGLLFSKNQSGERTLRNAALLVHRRGALDDRQIAIVSSDQQSDRIAVERGLRPQLEALGYEIVRHSVISSDTGTQASQIPVEVTQTRSAGADAVFFVMNPVPITQWVHESDGQGYRPRYVLADTLGATTDFTLQNLPESFDGWGVTVTQQGFDLLGAEPAPDRACREKYEAQTGGELPPPGEAGYRNATVYCGLVGLLGRALRSGGASSPAALVAAFDSFGEVALPDTGGASFGPGKHDGADLVRLLRADMSRRRWVPSGAFERGV